MTTRQTGTILRYLRSLVDVETTRGQTDAQLLQRFATKREEAAFAALVQRHGALVRGVCQHLLHHEQDAEDAFQATFLVLARRAGSIRKSEALGSFLHGVAYRIALRAKQNARRRQVHERQAAGPPSEQPPDNLAWRELQALLDEEVARLPVKYRSPFVLCCLEGKFREEAARELGCKIGTLSSRIARAREMLQSRLAGRGVSLPAALCAAVLWKQTAEAAVPALLVSHTVQAAVGSAEGISAAVATLAEDALRVMGFGRWQIAGALILSVGLLTAAGVGHYVAIAPPPAAPQDTPATPAEVRKDRYGDPLPPAALARLGTVRQRAPDSHLAVTADGKEIIAVGNDLIVRRFDARTGALRSVRQSPLASGALQYRTWLSPHGTFALTTKMRGLSDYLCLWSLDKGIVRQKLPLPPESQQFFCGAAFSADERHVAVADIFLDRKTFRVLIWDLETSKSRVVWSEKKDKEVTLGFKPFVALSPDGKRLVVYHLDQILRCWEVESGKLLWQVEEKKRCPLFVFSADSRIVYTRSEIEKTPGVTTVGIDIRDAATGKLLDRKKPPKEASVPIGSSPDGRFLAFQTMTEEVVLWEPGKEKVTFRFPRPPYRRDDPFLFGYTPNRLPTNFAFMPDGKGFIRRAGSLQRWDLSTGKAVYTDTEKWGHTEEVTRLIFSPNSRLLASSSKDRMVRLWDVPASRTTHAFSKDDSDHCDYLAFTPDGRFLLSVPSIVYVGQDVLKAIDVTSGRFGRSFKVAADCADFASGVHGKELRVSTDGKKIMMLNWKGDKNILTVWNAATGERLIHKNILAGKESLLTPNGQSVLTFDSATQSVKLLAIDTGALRWQQGLAPPHDRQRTAYECDLALSPNGRLMAASRFNFNDANSRRKHDAILLGDMATGRQLLKLSTGESVLFDFSADSRLFGVAGRAGVRLWETASWQEIGSLRIDDGKSRPADCACASSLAFSPDGRTLATGHRDGTILLWDATLRRGAHGGPLRAAEREALWSDLAGADAAKAYATVWRFADDRAASISFLKQRLRPVPPVPAETLRTLLDDLDSDQFKVREAAEGKLRELGERVVTPLREVLKTKPSLEMRRRVEGLLAALEIAAPLSGEPLRAARAVQALERIGSAEAWQLLEELSQGVESAKLTQAAKESLTRLKKR